MRFRQRATKNSEVLGEHKHQAAVDGTITGDDTITRQRLFFHAEVGTAVFFEHIPLFERIRVQEQFDTLAGSQFALGVLRVDALLSSAQTRLFALLFELMDDVMHSGTP